MNYESFNPKNPAQKKESLGEQGHHISQSEGGILARREEEKRKTREENMRKELEQKDAERRTMVRQKTESLAVIIFERQKKKEKDWDKLVKEGNNGRVEREKKDWQEVLKITIQEKARELGVDSSLVGEQIEIIFKELRERERM